jgi:hypothetical protein
MNYWYEASALDGPWTVAKIVPPSMEQIKQSCGGQAGGPAGTFKRCGSASNSANHLRQYRSGRADPVGWAAAVFAYRGTELLQVKNSDIIFMYVKTNDYCVLLSGRWFKARSLIGPGVCSG